MPPTSYQLCSGWLPLAAADANEGTDSDRSVIVCAARPSCPRGFVVVRHTPCVDGTQITCARLRAGTVLNQGEGATTACVTVRGNSLSVCPVGFVTTAICLSSSIRICGGFDASVECCSVQDLATPHWRACRVGYGFYPILGVPGFQRCVGLGWDQSAVVGGGDTAGLSKFGMQGSALPSLSALAFLGTWSTSGTPSATTPSVVLVANDGTLGLAQVNVLGTAFALRGVRAGPLTLKLATTPSCVAVSGPKSVVVGRVGAIEQVTLGDSGQLWFVTHVAGSTDGTAKENPLVDGGPVSQPLVEITAIASRPGSVNRDVFCITENAVWRVSNTVITLFSGRGEKDVGARTYSAGIVASDTRLQHPVALTASATHLFVADDVQGTVWAFPVSLSRPATSFILLGVPGGAGVPRCHPTVNETVLSRPVALSYLAAGWNDGTSDGGSDVLFVVDGQFAGCILRLDDVASRVNGRLTAAAGAACRYVVPDACDPYRSEVQSRGYRSTFVSPPFRTAATTAYPVTSVSVNAAGMLLLSMAGETAVFATPLSSPSVRRAWTATPSLRLSGSVSFSVSTSTSQSRLTVSFSTSFARSLSTSLSTTRCTGLAPVGVWIPTDSASDGMSDGEAKDAAVKAYLDTAVAKAASQHVRYQRLLLTNPTAQRVRPVLKASPLTTLTTSFYVSTTGCNVFNFVNGTFALAAYLPPDSVQGLTDLGVNNSASIRSTDSNRSSSPLVASPGEQVASILRALTPFDTREVPSLSGLPRVVTRSGTSASVVPLLNTQQPFLVVDGPFHPNGDGLSIYGISRVTNWGDFILVSPTPRRDTVRITFGPYKRYHPTLVENVVLVFSPSVFDTATEALRIPIVMDPVVERVFDPTLQDVLSGAINGALLTSMLSQSPIVAMRGGRVQFLMRTTECPLEDTAVPLDFGQHPIGISLGEGKYRYYIGAVILNTALMAVIVVLYFGVAALYWAIRGRHFDVTKTYGRSLRFLRMPSILVAPYALYIQPTLTSAIKALINGQPRGGEQGERSVSSLVLLFLILIYSYIVYLMFCEFEARAKTTASMNALEVQLKGHIDWQNISNPQGGKGFVQKYGSLFHEFVEDRYWYILVELGFTIAFAVSDAPSLSSIERCLISRVVVGLALVCYVAVFALLRPMQSRVKQQILTAAATCDAIGFALAAMSFAPFMGILASIAISGSALCMLAMAIVHVAELILVKSDTFVGWWASAQPTQAALGKLLAGHVGQHPGGKLETEGEEKDADDVDDGDEDDNDEDDPSNGVDPSLLSPGAREAAAKLKAARTQQRRANRKSRLASPHAKSEFFVNNGITYRISDGSFLIPQLKTSPEAFALRYNPLHNQGSPKLSRAPASAGAGQQSLAPLLQEEEPAAGSPVDPTVGYVKPVFVFDGKAFMKKTRRLKKQQERDDRRRERELRGEIMMLGGEEDGDEDSSSSSSSQDEGLVDKSRTDMKTIRRVNPLDTASRRPRTREEEVFDMI